MIFKEKDFKGHMHKVTYKKQQVGLFENICKKIDTPYHDHYESFERLLNVYLDYHVDYEDFTLTDDKLINWPNMAFGTTKKSNCADNAYIAYAAGRYINATGWIIGYAGYNYDNPISHLEHFMYVFYDFASLVDPKKDKDKPICLWNKFDETRGDIKHRYPSLQFFLLHLNHIVNRVIYAHNKFLSISNVKDHLSTYLVPPDLDVLNYYFNANGLTHSFLFNKMPMFSEDYNLFLQSKAKRIDEVIQMAHKSKLTEAEIKENDDRIWTQIEEMYKKDSEKTLQYLNEEEKIIDETKKNNLGYAINKSIEQDLKRFGSYEAYWDHLEQIGEQYEKLISQTSQGKTYFERKQRLLSLLENDPTVHPENFAFVDGKPIRIN